MVGFTGVLSWRWRPRHRISLWPQARSQWVATLPRNVRRRGRRRYGGAFVAMAPSPSYQPVALRSVAMDCDPPAQRTTTRASSLRVRFRGDVRRRGRRRYGCVFVAMCDDEGVVATKFNKWPNAIANRKSKNRKSHYQLPSCARHLARAVVFRINRLILRCCTFALAFGGALCHNMGPSGVNWFEFFSRNDPWRRE